MGLTRRELMQGVGAMAVCLKSGDQPDKESPKEVPAKTAENSEFEIALLDRNGNPITERQPFVMGFTDSGVTNEAEIRFKPLQERYDCQSFRIYRAGLKWQDGSICIAHHLREGDVASFVPKAVTFTLEQ